MGSLFVVVVCSCYYFFNGKIPILFNGKRPGFQLEGAEWETLSLGL